jgi:4-azaleucine resistance transporter AzlC
MTALPAPDRRAEFREGVLTSLPAALAAMPFAFLLGALATERGLGAPEVALMSATVFAGSAQFIALDSWISPPAWLAVGLATLVVNLRHVFMSASLRGRMHAFPRGLRPAAMLFLADEIWAFAEARAAQRRLTPAYYAGLVAFFYLGWVAAATIGALAGRLIEDPKRYGFDFAFVAIFIGLILGFRQRRGFAVTIAASAIAATGLSLLHPGPLSIAGGAVAGMAAAALACGKKEEA